METSKNWGKPNQIKLPKEVSDFLLNACNEHLNKVNAKFSSELILTENIKEEFWIHGEFTSNETDVILTVKARKMKTTYQLNSIVVPSGNSQNTLSDSSTI